MADTTPRFTIASPALSATIDPLGAELWSLTDSEGRALMTEVACWFQHPFVRDENALQARPVARAGGTEEIHKNIIWRKLQQQRAKNKSGSAEAADE